jgi:hypothetical protein
MENARNEMEPEEEAECLLHYVKKKRGKGPDKEAAARGKGPNSKSRAS